MKPTRIVGSRSPRAVQGATLIELLAVILILLMITAMTIPVVSPSMTGRRIREGARMLSTFLNAARNRAIETGRPAGVWIERKAGMAEISENFYMAEIPPAYGGDFVDSQVECSVIDAQGHLWRDDNGRNMRDFWNIVVPRTRSSFMTDVWSNPDPMEQQVVREGDLIQFEGHDRLYPLKIVEMQLPFGGKQTKWWYILRGINSDTGTLPYHNRTNMHGRWTISWFDRTHAVSWNHIVRTLHFGNFTNHAINPDASGIRYKIYRQPIRLQAGSMRMPETVAVDLNFSSMTFGTWGNEDKNRTSLASVDISGIPFHPRRDPADKSKPPIPYWGDPVYANDDTPVVIVFSAGGQIERVYCHRRDSVGNWSWDSTEAYGPIYLLVGDREHITPETFSISQKAAENSAIQLRKNWLHLDALWVRITPNTGNISVSLVNDPNYEAVDKDFGIVAADPTNVYLTRKKARVDRLIGGR